jgi:hypothetical protein
MIRNFDRQVRYAVSIVSVEDTVSVECSPSGGLIEASTCRVRVVPSPVRSIPLFVMRVANDGQPLVVAVEKLARDYGIPGHLVVDYRG